jgi:hypothetical protein
MNKKWDEFFIEQLRKIISTTDPIEKAKIKKETEKAWKKWGKKLKKKDKSK